MMLLESSSDSSIDQPSFTAFSVCELFKSKAHSGRLTARPEVTPKPV